MNQTALLQANEDKAIETLSVLIKDKHDRTEASEHRPQRLCLVDRVYDDCEKGMIDKIKNGLKL